MTETTALQTMGKFSVSLRLSKVPLMAPCTQDKPLPPTLPYTTPRNTSFHLPLAFADLILQR